MTLNLLKKYNALLDIDCLDESMRTQSLKKIFERDFVNNKFNNKKITPTPIDGESTMDTLFNHLTKSTDCCNGGTSRVFDSDRSKRIHWIKYHFDNFPHKTSVFSVEENRTIRTYIFNEQESYVIILEPKSGDYYFLITAYYIRGGNNRKIKNKAKRKLDIVY